MSRRVGPRLVPLELVIDGLRSGAAEGCASSNGVAWRTLARRAEFRLYQLTSLQVRTSA
jgi:hypothetical protein